MQAAGGRRVDWPKAGGAASAAVAAGLLGQASPQLPIGRRPLENPPQQGLQVKRRAADEQHRPAAAANVAAAPARRVEVLRQAALLVGASMSSR